MGKWHRPTQIALTLKKIQLDIPIDDIYEWELGLGWTECLTTHDFWSNTKDRIKKLTGNDVYAYIKSNTINYRKVLDARKHYLIKMSKKSKPLTKEERQKIYKELSKEELTMLIEGLQERIEELEEEKKEHDKIKSRCLTYVKIESIFQYNHFKIKKHLICKLFNLSKRTLNNKLSNNSLYRIKNVRKDSIIHSPKFNAITNKIFEDSKNTYGHRRVHKELEKCGICCSKRTVAYGMKHLFLFAAERTGKKKKRELKNTKNPGTYYLDEVGINNYSISEAYSIDFSQIETAAGVMYMHGARDVISGEMLFVELVDNQKKETVIEHLKKLPATTKVVNSDYGSSYVCGDTEAFLESRNIKHSLGKVGCSYDNRWIEDFWKRIKHEWFSQYPTKNSSNEYVKQLIDKYFLFFNNRRLIKKSGSWTTIPEFKKNFVK